MSLINRVLAYEYAIKEAVTNAILAEFGYPNDVEIHYTQNYMCTEFVRGYESICRIKIEITSKGLKVNIRSNYPKIIEAIQNVITH
ncbi:hypothetical protein ZZ1p0130 [Acinetobacter phage ZZ1]|jgi:hypothetical protein|uniref:Uncharacterized protein n=3 Tax=Caudoviricetes TaxID=2731619 RepID=A0A410T5E1_9CAUD|nr:hypothetical protein ZZ1p0130 [Acinetobacter phage ZZ1]AFL47451.1 hypothetical protein ZZ1p0130 [Acinetobacter phage ZZ1]QAU03982.1 hypothetical protein Henu6_gp179 [Acinetobacter phage Henu6]